MVIEKLFFIITISLATERTFLTYSAKQGSANRKGKKKDTLRSNLSLSLLHTQCSSIKLHRPPPSKPTL